MTNTPPEISEEIRSDGANEINSLINHYFDIHLVTCPDCGTIFTHKAHIEGDTEIACPRCNRTYEAGECPDFFY